ncbi:MAG: dUTP diphosphatase [Oscillospiraceae bacterium]
MNKFEKVSFEQYKSSVGKKTEIEVEYNEIKLPRRATTGSAGYDFFAPFSFTLNSGETIKIPTGIRVQLDDDKFLAVYPRSGLGFKFRLQLDNTVGVIDSDYYSSDNEGHIMAKITNDSRDGRTVTINKGEAFMQGVITQFFKTVDDNADGIRNGGFGSTE